jgi:hypothetical protein
MVLAQSADWQKAVWREPQVRYLLADMTMGGNVAMYREYAEKEKDPDSREAIRLWDAGVRAVNTGDFERKWIPNRFGKDGRVMRIVFRGSNRTITGSEVLLTSDYSLDQVTIRIMLLDLSLERPIAEIKEPQANPSVAEALRRWADGVRVLNLHWFEAKGQGKERRIVYRGTDSKVDGTKVQLNCDLAYPETNVRYFMADIALGGSIEFYRKTAEVAHEMGCLEAVRRTEEGYTITNLDQFERKQMNGQTLITRKGSNKRISGMEVWLSSNAERAAGQTEDMRPGTISEAKKGSS